MTGERVLPDLDAQGPRLEAAFRIEDLAVEDPPAELHRRSILARRPRATLRSWSILVVDEDTPIRRMLDRTLRAEGYEVVAAADGGAALAAEEEAVAALSIALGHARVGVTALVPQTASLEELFLGLTEEDAEREQAVA